jgi:hypothetical protein
LAWHSMDWRNMARTRKPKPMQMGSPDDFQTPPGALEPLIPYIPKTSIIWEPACGKGYLVKALEDEGYVVFGTDIIFNKVSDFLTTEPSDKAYIIITNPPFSLKNEFIARCYELGRPFALLLPLAALESKERQTQWKKGLQLILLDRRLHFETPNNIDKSNSWFATAWFTNGLNLPKDIMFGTVSQPKIIKEKI